MINFGFYISEFAYPIHFIIANMTVFAVILSFLTLFHVTIDLVNPSLVIVNMMKYFLCCLLWPEPSDK